MKHFLSTVALLTWIAALCVPAIKIDCENPDAINEDHIHFCCKHPDGHNDLIEACSKQTGFKLPSPNEESIVDITADRAIAGTCFGKCVFGQLKFMKNENDLDMEAVRKYFPAAHPDDPEYVKEMINAFDHCHGVSEENTAKFMSNPMFKNMAKDFCEPKSSVILACVVREFFHNCPADRWSKTEECKNTLEFSKKCKNGLTTM